MPVRYNIVDYLEQTEGTFLNRTRRLVETAIGQLTGQFIMSKICTRKM